MKNLFADIVSTGSGRRLRIEAGLRYRIDYERFTDRYSGLDFRLTGVEEPRVVHDILV